MGTSHFVEIEIHVVKHDMFIFFYAYYRCSVLAFEEFVKNYCYRCIEFGLYVRVCDGRTTELEALRIFRTTRGIFGFSFFAKLFFYFRARRYSMQTLKLEKLGEK